MYCCEVSVYVLFCNGVWESVCVLLVWVMGVMDVVLFVVCRIWDACSLSFILF